MRDQQKVLDFVRNEILFHGVAPSHQEMMGALGFRSKRHLSNQINRLVNDGFLDRETGKRRGLSLTEKSIPDHRPMGTISAGKPVEAIPDDQRFNLYSILFPPGAFPLVISGDSMIEEGLFDGDVVIMVPAQTARNSEIVYAQIDGSEATLKRIYVRPDKIILKACNPAYPPMEYEPDRVEIRAKFHKGIAMSR